MGSTVMLDSGPLGRLCTPVATPEVARAWEWVMSRINSGDKIAIPEIADYEVRRELIRTKRSRSIKRLDDLASAQSMQYIAISTRAIRLAAELWAATRNTGYPTSHSAALDGDVILASQAILLADTGTEVTVLTMNEPHLSRFVPTLNWNQII